MIASKEKVGEGARPSEYGKYLEYGTVRMKPRSFIRLAFYKHRANIERIMQKVFIQNIRNG